MINTDFVTLGVYQYYYSNGALPGLPLSTPANGSQSATAIVKAFFVDPWCNKGTMTRLDSRLLSQLNLSVSWRDATAIATGGTGGTTTLNNAQVVLSVREWQNVPQTIRPWLRTSRSEGTDRRAAKRATGSRCTDRQCDPTRTIARDPACGRRAITTGGQARGVRIDRSGPGTDVSAPHQQLDSRYSTNRCSNLRATTRSSWGSRKTIGDSGWRDPWMVRLRTRAAKEGIAISPYVGGQSRR